ncbi:MAG: hypothetical protein GF308_05930 [Candidatus Heimdallarchaeota archaeon]|nr:hypothetical protein [Candidatus Heimdallarchaeota archaeon]
MSKVSIAGTIRADIGLEKGIDLLLEGGKAIDAVEETIRIVEDNLEDWTVGSGGLPNLLGEVELDASIMDGRTLKAGAVAGLKYHKNPISIARKVMEKTPHVMLVGEGADQFADVLGLERTELLTENGRDLYEDFLAGREIIEREYDSEKTMGLKERYYKSFKRLVKDHNLMDWYRRYAKENHGTVNVLARDQKGNICCGVSTSGLSFKLPGRTGDSPIIGAGNYADNRYGAAACVGVGEIAIRLSLARIAVYDLSRGLTIEEAATNAIHSLTNLEKDAGSLAILVMDKKGNVISAANFEDYHYWIATSDNPKPQKKQSLFIDTKNRDKKSIGYHR